jgi:glycosyltransferase involved in cell wall biosynthesis
MRPTATIVICAHNEEAWIARAIDSALSHQSLSDVLVVDDHSDDRTAEIARTYERVTVIPCEGRGIVDVNNTALRRAAGDVVIHLDADDRLLPGAAEALLAPFEDPDVVFVVGSSIVDEGERDIDAKIVFPTHRHLAVASMALNPIPHTGVALRREPVLVVGGYRSASDGTTFAEDYDLWIRLFDSGSRCVGVPKVVGRQTLRSTGVTGLHHDQQAARTGQIQRAYRDRHWERDGSMLVTLGRELAHYEQADVLRDRWSVMLMVLAGRFMRERRPVDASIVVVAAIRLGPIRMVRASFDRRRRMRRRREALTR